MDIYELVNKYISAGYSEDDAIPKSCSRYCFT